MQRAELDRGLLKHRGIDDRIAAIDRFGLVPGHRHSGGAGYAGALKVADRCAAEVVNKSPRGTRLAAGLCPCISEVSDWRSIRMHEYPRDDRFGGPLDRTDTLALCLQNCIQFHSEGK